MATNETAQEEMTFRARDLGDTDTITLTGEELRRLLALEQAEGAGGNPEPAVEEGPHLDDPAIRAAKAEQLRAAGYKKNSAALTDAMQAVLRGDAESE